MPPARMRPASNAREFVHAPVGRYVAGRTWIACCPSSDLAGFVLWGCPSEGDAGAFLDVLPAPGVAFADKRARFVDVRRLETPEPGAFAAFAARCHEHATLLPRIVSRAAVIHGGGLGGALAGGFGDVAPTPFPVALFTEPAPALAWLGAGDHPTLFEELAQLRDHAATSSPLLRQLQLVLGANVKDATLASVAARLGLSARSLQRRLHAEHVSFQDEVHRARVEHAQRLLRETDATVAEIARQVGCASPDRLTLLFREATGRTPTRWRDEHVGSS